MVLVRLPWACRRSSVRHRPTTTTGSDPVYMRMVDHGRLPSVQHKRHTDAGAQMLRISSNREQGLGSCLEQDAIQDLLVVIGEIPDRRWQRED